VHLRIAGREVACKVAPVSDGTETYVPLEILSAVGATGEVNAKGDAAIVTLKTPPRRAELALARPNGKPMLALSDLARFLNAVVVGPEMRDKDGKLIPGMPTDRVYLLARITEARFENGALRVATSFPVPFRVRAMRDVKPARSYLDCLGAKVEKDFQPAPLPEGEKRALRLRAGQFDTDIARIVVELDGRNALCVCDTPDNAALTILAKLEEAPPGAAQSAETRVQSPVNPGESAMPSFQKPVEDGGATQNAERMDRNPNVPGNVSTASAPMPAPPTLPAATPTRGSRGTKAARGGTVNRAPLLVRGLTFAPDSDTLAHLEIATSGKAAAYVHYVDGTNQMTVDIPNAVLNLAAPDASDQKLSHPLVSALHVAQVQDAPPLTRVTLDMTRVVGFTVNPQADRLSVELRLPRNATGALSDKLIVVDAGHGGSSSGAVGRGGGTVYEKNVTLAIALKLRAALEACGARVVMTRDRDVDVPLYDRPRLANDIGADLFISIHNDSNGTPNSASGTSTYYHMGDPSSRALAICVQQAVSAVTGLPNRGALSDGILYASGLAVLRVSRMPAVLCEVAYINNARDRSKLVDPEFQQRVAQAMCDGLRNYVEGQRRVASVQTPDPMR